MVLQGAKNIFPILPLRKKNSQNTSTLIFIKPLKKSTSGTVSLNLFFLSSALYKFIISLSHDCDIHRKNQDSGRANFQVGCFKERI